MFRFLGVSRAIAEICAGSGPGAITMPIRGRARWAAVALALALLLPAAANAKNCLNGGTALYTPTDLDGIRINLAGKFCLGSDIDLNGISWVPIGGSPNPFTGALDGVSCSNLSDTTTCKTHVIKNLTIVLNSAPDVVYGLFGDVSGASIANVGLVGVNIQITTAVYSVSVGGLAGSTDTTTIENSYVTGTISASVRDGEVGGLLGVANSGSIQSSFSTVAVSVKATGSFPSGFGLAGGLAGICSRSTIDHSFATGSVTGNATFAGKVGGLVGDNQACTVDSSYATGSVSGGDGSPYSLVGGLAGETSSGASVIRKSYATGTVSGGSASVVGGLVGDAVYVSISQSYATGNVSGGANSKIGGLVGLLEGALNGLSATITESYATGLLAVGSSGAIGGLVAQLGYNASVSPTSYWDTQASGQTTSAGGTGLTTAQLKVGLPSGFDPTVWGIVPSITYPYLLWQIIPPVAVNESAATVANTPVTIDLTAGASGNPTSAALVGTPVGGTVTGFPATTVTFTPATGFTGAASFQFTLANANGTSNTATATITVTAPPTAVDESASTTKGTPVTIDLTAGASGKPTSAALVSAPIGGTVSGFPATTVTFTPKKGFTGAGSFQFTLANAYGTSNTATATITVAKGSPPVAMDQNVETTAGTPITFDLAKNATGSPTLAKAPSKTPHGTISASFGTMVTYTPDSCFAATDSFTFTLSNAYGKSNAATATITVTPATSATLAVHLVDPFRLGTNLKNIVLTPLFQAQNWTDVEAKGLAADGVSAAIAVVQTNDCTNDVTLFTTSNGITLLDWDAKFLTTAPPVGGTQQSVTIKSTQLSPPIGGFRYGAALVQGPVGASAPLFTGLKPVIEVDAQQGNQTGSPDGCDVPGAAAGCPCAWDLGG
jgi:hypothetical protein